MKYFISGHRDITKDEFELYRATIKDAIENDQDVEFVVGDYEGVDIMAQEYLKELNYNKVTVYHMFTSPRNIASDNFMLRGGFTSDEERDAAMTRDSDMDIAFLRKGKRNSGTAQNIIRRFEKL
jgi:hypothetical protein